MSPILFTLSLKNSETKVTTISASKDEGTYLLHFLGNTKIITTAMIVNIIEYILKSDADLNTLINFVTISFPLIACINAIYYGVFCKALLVEFSLNVLTLCVLGVLLYAVHVWAGGDSKLLILVALAMPARLYHYYKV